MMDSPLQIVSRWVTLGDFKVVPSATVAFEGGLTIDSEYPELSPGLKVTPGMGAVAV
jgi:hypothetical protein